MGDYKAIINESHERCRKSGLDKEQVYSLKIISDANLQKILVKNRNMIMTALPFIEELIKFTKGSDFFVFLTDNEGCILSALGDEKILSEAFTLMMIPGAYMNEESVGTNAMSYVIKTGNPVQLTGEDHYIDAYKRWTCSAAPIKDNQGNIIGVIDLTGYTKNVHPHTLGIVVAIAKAIEEIMFKEIERTNDFSFSTYKYNFDKIIGEDDNFIKITEYAKKIADSSSTVLIVGESGTGKELFAQSIHNYSSRNNSPMIAINCGAIPGQLIESELFGYEDGAFTGAKKGGNPGKFELADGGTILLDEIGEMPLDMQVKLLRVLEEGFITRLGGKKPIPVDVRMIASTNKDLEGEVASGRFRKDLYYRLNVLPLYVPPLRERKGDIRILTEYFMNKISKDLNKNKINIADENLILMEKYDWPGNIRELQNIVELIINTETFPTYYFTKKEQYMHNYNEENMDIETVEKEHLIKIIKRCNGNITHSADILGIRRNTLYSKIKKYNIKI
jgi:transcriptional regulator of acetoin/glycerol metabolism